MGMDSLSLLAREHLGAPPSVVLAMTAEKGPRREFAPNVASYLNEVFGRTPIKVPSGAVIYY